MDDSESFEIGSILSWQQVSAVHRVRIGIYQRSGKLISLLTDFGRINPCYPDRQDPKGDIIVYTGNGRRGDQKLDKQNLALLESIETTHSVPLFNKHGPNKWEFMGYWRVIDGAYMFDTERERMVWKFTLERSN